MARISREQALANLHQEAMAEFDRIQSALRDERLQCLKDRRFYSIAGAQWEGPLSKQFENKPKFEVNKVHLSVIRIFNEFRNNRISVAFVSKEGREDDPLAETCNDLYRADEQDSVAEEAYDNAFEEAVGGGFGAWRLRTEYVNEEDEDDDKQRIRIEPIYDADSSVWFDLDAKRQDKADAKCCFVLTSMTPAAYEREWNDSPASWPKEVQQLEFDWASPDVVYVAEYYKVEEVSETIRIFRTLAGQEEKHSQDEFDEDEELEARLAATGARELRRKRVKRRKVRKYILSGAKVLEDCGHIAGRHIPIVPVYGKRWFVDNVERCMGHVRLAKDAQRLKNMQLSKLGEIAALSSVEKPIVTPEQVAGHTQMWSNDNLTNFPYLLLNPITDVSGNQQPAGPMAYTKPPQIPPALAGMLALTEQDMQEILGAAQQADKMVSNISGKAVEMIQQRLDMQAYIYLSNMGKAVKRCGEVWLSMAKDVFVEQGRKMKAIGAQGEVSTVELMRPIMSDDGEVEHENDLSDAEFDVAVTVGPSSSSKRAATVRALTGMMAITPDPETQKVLQAMAMMNMEGEGIDEVREYFRKQLVQQGVLKPTDEEAQAMAQAAQEPPPPTPEQQYLITQAQKALAEADKIKAEAQKIAAEFSPEMIQAKQAGEVAKIDADVEKARLQAETARLNADVARIKALAEVEMEREKARAVVEAPQRETNSNPPLIVVDQNGGIQKVMAPAIEAMSMALADAGAAIESLAQSQGQMVEKMDANHAQSERSRKSKVVVRKAADGSYVGERIDG
jgi:hypothetical protein